jgi:hypothetical protein
MTIRANVVAVNGPHGLRMHLLAPPPGHLVPHMIP